MDRCFESTQVLPQFDTLIHICYELEISLLDLLSKEKLCDKAFRKISQKYLTRSPTPRVSPKSFDQNQVRDILSAVVASNEEPPRTMKELAKRLGYDIRSISRHFSDLCHAISTKCRHYDIACRLKKIEQLSLHTQRLEA